MSCVLGFIDEAIEQGSSLHYSCTFIGGVAVRVLHLSDHHIDLLIIDIIGISWISYREDTKM